MPIEIRELIIQALVGGSKDGGNSSKQEIKKRQTQTDVAEIVAKMLKQEKER